MTRTAGIASIVLLLGPAVVAGVVVGPPAERLNSSPAWVKNIEYPGPGAWEWLRASADESEVWFYTRQNATRDGSTVSAWRRVEFRDPQPAAAVSQQWAGTYLSLVERVDVNCSNPAERRRAASGFRGRNLTDPIEPALVLDEAHSHWQPALPGGASAAFVNRVCGLLHSRGMQPH